VQKGETPEDLATYTLPARGELASRRLSHLIAEAGLAASASEARRFIDQGAVSINGETIATNVAADTLSLATDDVVRVGRGRYVKIVVPEG
jgi:ribosomal protein S4